jgi:hypothetical protein
MTDAYQNRIVTVVPRLRDGAIGSGSFHDCSLGFLACMNDILNRKRAEKFFHWAVPGEHAVLDPVEESAGLPKELLARSRAKLRHRSRACCSKQPAGES